MRKHRAKPILAIGAGFSAMLASVLSLAPAQAQMLAPAQTAGTTTTHSVMFGGTTPLVPEQGKVGHLGIVRTYYNMGEQFVGPMISETMGHQSSMLLSYDDPTSDGPSYASIAAGQHDSEIRSFFVQVEADAVANHIPAVYVAFEHEANAPSHARLGSPAEFAAAYRHIHQLAAEAKLNWNTGGRLHWVLILEHMAYFTKAERPHWSLSMGFASDYYPGASYVDYLAADGYNQGSCGDSSNPHYLQTGDEMVTPGSMFDPVLTFAQQHAKPVIIAEWASIPYTDSALRPKYIRSMESYVLAHRQIRGVSYWDSQGKGSKGKGGGPSSVACDFSVNNDAQSMAALNAMNRALQNEKTTTGKHPSHHTAPMRSGKSHHSATMSGSTPVGNEAISQGIKVVSQMLAAGK